MNTNQPKPLKRYNQFVYVLASIPVLVLAIGGLSYGGFWIYVVLFLLVTLQCISPTKPGWIIIFGLYLIAAISYLVFLVTDIFRLVRGIRAMMLIDLDDSVMFVVIECILVTLLYLLYGVRPLAQQRQQGQTE